MKHDLIDPNFSNPAYCMGKAKEYFAKAAATDNPALKDALVAAAREFVRRIEKSA